MITVLIVFAFLLYPFTLPLRLHYRMKYAKRPAAFAWSGVKTFAVLALLLCSILFWVEVTERLL